MKLFGFKRVKVIDISLYFRHEIVYRKFLWWPLWKVMDYSYITYSKTINDTVKVYRKGEIKLYWLFGIWEYKKKISPTFTEKR